jgi:RHO1 GDP-GTP exchange protein 1/2
LLLITSPPEETNGNGTTRSQARKPQALVRKSSFNKERAGVPMAASSVKNEPKGQHWINFIHLGRKYYNLVLWAGTPMSHKKWLEAIYKQQQLMRDRSTIFDTVTLNEGFFVGHNKVNCAAPYSKRFSLSFYMNLKSCRCRRRTTNCLWHG